MENPIKMDDLGVPLFSETSIYIYIYIHIYGMEVSHRTCYKSQNVFIAKNGVFLC